MKQNVICIIMGGGRGTRLYPLTKNRCKAAVPFAGKYRLVDIPISNCLHSGYNQIYLLTQFNTASLHKHIQMSFKFDPFSGGFVDILSAEQTTFREDWYQGTADAVRQNMCHFAFNEDDLFLILSGDQLYRMNFQEIVQHHNHLGADVTIAAKTMPKSAVSALGVMRVADDFSVTEFVEKPQDPSLIDSLVISEKLRGRLSREQESEVCLVSMGIYVFNGRVMAETLANNTIDFGQEILPSLLGKKGLYSFIFDDYWEDLGTIKAFFDTNLMITETVPSFNFFDADRPIYTHPRYLPPSKLNGANVSHSIIPDGCIITQAQLHRCVLGIRSVINDHSKLRNVVMMGADRYETIEELQTNKNNNIPHMGIGKNCNIYQTIIDKNVRIGNNVSLSPEGKPDKFVKGDVCVREGILIVNKGAILPDGTTI